MSLVIVVFALQLVFVHSKGYESNRTDSNSFLKGKSSLRDKYEQARENVESTREACVDEYRQQQTSYKRRQMLPPYCKQYCTETMDCESSDEQSACINGSYPAWPSRTLKFVQKFNRICYIRITDVSRYEKAERICEEHGLQLAIIDNIRLLEKLKDMQMFNTTCKGQCPQARGYYIGLKRQIDEDELATSKWVWSDNVTWTQKEIDCGDDYSRTSFANASLLCYIGRDGEKKVTVWNIGEPNNYQSGGLEKGEQCVEIIARPDDTGSFEQVGRLNDIPCHKPTLGALCQMDDLKPLNSSQFDSFAAIVGFNETEPEESDSLDDLLAKFGPVEANLEAMAAMAAALEGLLVLPSFSTKQATNVLNVVDQLVNVTGQVEVEEDEGPLKTVTNKLLRFLDKFPTKIEIKEDQGTSFKYDNMNTSLVNINIDQWHGQMDSEWFTIISENSEEYPNSIIELNMRVLRTQLESRDDDYRIVETIFSNFNLFPQPNKTNQTDEDRNQLLGVPISYQIANRTTMKADEDLVRFQIRVSEAMKSSNISCAYWSFEENNGSWVTDSGCRFSGFINDYAQCYCNHLTHFALLMLPESERIIESLSAIEELILTFVTYIGIALSIFGLVMTLITYALFRFSQKNRLHASLFMLCLSILFVNCLYIPFSITKPNQYQVGRVSFCNIVGFLFHYFLITSFMWMLIMAAIQYTHFVRIFNSHISHFFVKTGVIGWVLPLLFPFLVVLIGKNGGYTGENRCWINDDILLYTTFVAPICVIILFNLILFIFTVKSIFRHDPALASYQHSRSKLQLGAALCCFVSIGCTWLFGILVLLQPSFVHQLIFCISNSLQGFLIFLFHIYLSKPKRELWQTFFIQRGFHPRPHSASGQTGLLTASNSSAANISSLTRPVKFRFASRSSTSDSQGTSATTNPAFTDSHGNPAIDKDQIQSARISHLSIRSQPEFLYDRIQKAKFAMNSSYA